ncbi:MAG: PadR family transcriptional regulator [Nitrososphaerota archaeon]
MAYERLVRKVTHENLWLYILTLLKEGPLYGYELRKLIEERFGFKPGQVTAYLVLYRLVGAGYIRVVGESRGSRGPSRRYYEITDKGLEVLGKARVFLSEILGKLG